MNCKRISDAAFEGVIVGGGHSRPAAPMCNAVQARSTEAVVVPGETRSAFVMDAVSRTLNFRKSQQDFLARGMVSAERARTKGGYVPAAKVIAGLRKRIAAAQRTRK